MLGFAAGDRSATQYLYVEDSDEELRDWVAKVVLADGTSAKVDLKDELQGRPRTGVKIDLGEIRTSRQEG